LLFAAIAHVGSWHFCDIEMRRSTSAFGQC
jgi:hypothetical protein